MSSDNGYTVDENSGRYEVSYFNSGGSKVMEVFDDPIDAIIAAHEHENRETEYGVTVSEQAVQDARRLNTEFWEYYGK